MATLVLLLLAAPVWSQAPGPNKLTADEVREGWILLYDGESAIGWKRQADSAFATFGRNGQLIFEPRNGNAWQGQPPPDFNLMAETRGSLQFSVFFWKKLDRMLSAESGDGWQPFTYTPTQEILRTFGFSAKDGQAAVRSVKLLPQNMTPLFNGIDLSGWKAVEGKKSKFEVKDGFLSVKGGPGDLQTEGKYKNFLLQLECRTNGRHLKSGIFFRCQASEYQNGYKAQISNNFTASPPREYLVDNYDLPTKKWLDPIRVKSSAVDFGTGAIYGKIPARKEVAKDGEWFTLTLLAAANHFMVWVNGIQTADWYDYQLYDHNGRKFYSRDGGHISLQGHDPTSDLSFRNIRIVELPAL
jgi:hypothetical protein